MENVILGIVEEEEVGEQGGEGSEGFINNNPSALPVVLCVIQLRSVPDPMLYLHHLPAKGLQGNTQREM